MNIDNITFDKINELKAEALSNEINPTKAPVTPRTRFALKTLGYKRSDVSPAKHVFQFDIQNENEKGNRMIEEYMYWEAMISKLNKVSEMRQHIIDNNLLPSDSEQQRKLDEDMRERLNQANNRYNAIINTYQRQAKSIMNVQKNVIQKHLDFKQLQTDEYKQHQLKLKQQKKVQQQVQKQRAVEKKKIESLKKSRVADEIKRGKKGMKLSIENEKQLQEREMKQLNLHQMNIQRTFHEYVKKQQQRATKQQQALKDAENKEKNLEELYNNRLQKHSELTQQQINELHNKMEKRTAIHQQKINKIKKEEMIRKQNLLTKLHEKEIKLEEFKIAKAEENQRIARVRSKHRKTVFQNFANSYENAIKDLQKRQYNAEKRRKEAHLEQQRQLSMKRTMYKIKKNQAFERMKQSQRAKEFQHKLLADKLQNLDERYTTAKKIDTHIKWYTMLARDNAKFKFDEKLHIAEKANHDLNTYGIKDVSKSIENESFGIEKLSKQAMSRMLKQNISTLHSVPSGVERMTHHKAIQMKASIAF